MYYYQPNTRSLTYQMNCLISPIGSSVVFGAVFAGLDVVQGASPKSAFSLKHMGRYMAGLYVYNAVQCPMEAIHGRPSLFHNVVAAGMIGYIGVGRGVLGIPFVDPQFIYRYPQLSPQGLAFLVYGGMAGLLASFGGKRF